MPAKKTTPKKRPSGHEALKKSGRTGVLVPISDESLAIIDAACHMSMRSRSNFFDMYAIPAALEAAKRIIDEAK
jgi:uncharacterized protein (DUF1778 family)